MEKSAVFDVFKLQPDGSEQWVDSAKSFAAALFQAELAGVQSPGQYVISNQNGGDRETIHLDIRKVG